mmetsp:Transcript_58055/g.149460  ORF Transcript_58055/g.149460 Transcript_58055/m.149460 type:complete len:286 (-) Transcript_58055:18-875(-)
MDAELGQVPRDANEDLLRRFFHLGLEHLRRALEVSDVLVDTYQEPRLLLPRQCHVTGHGQATDVEELPEHLPRGLAIRHHGEGGRASLIGRPESAYVFWIALTALVQEMGAAADNLLLAVPNQVGKLIGDHVECLLVVGGVHEAAAGLAVQDGGDQRVLQERGDPLCLAPAQRDRVKAADSGGDVAPAVHAVELLQVRVAHRRGVEVHALPALDTIGHSLEEILDAHSAGLGLLRRRAADHSTALLGDTHRRQEGGLKLGIRAGLGSLGVRRPRPRTHPCGRIFL